MRTIRRLVIALLGLGLAASAWRAEVCRHRHLSATQPVPVAERTAPTPFARPPAERWLGSDAAPTNLRFCQHFVEAPAWAVGYGNEFWRRRGQGAPSAANVNAGGSKLPSSVNLGDLMERVSHALTMNGCANELASETNRPHAEAAGLPAQDDHVPVASLTTATYRASFDGQGLRFSPQPSIRDSEGNQAVEARFRTKSIGRGERSLCAGAEAAEWLVLGNTAQARLAEACGLVEHYEAMSAGVAVTWVIERPPPGAGPLAVEAELTGLTYAGQTPEGLHFADKSGTARLRVGRASAVDQAGNRWPLAMSARGGKLRVEVPESLLAQAQYPLAIDPLIGPEFGIDSPVTAPSGAAQSEPAVASNTNLYLVAWVDDRLGSGKDIFGARVSREGVLLDPHGLAICTAPSDQLVPAVAANGGDFLVVWEDQRNSGFEDYGADVYGARVTDAGAVLDPKGIAVRVSPVDQFSPAVASNGADWLVVWQQGSYNIHGARMSKDGRMRDYAIGICLSWGDQRKPAVASDGQDFLVAWYDTRAASGGTFGARVSGGGAVLDPDGILMSSQPRFEGNTAVAYNGLCYLVVWIGYHKQGQGWPRFEVPDLFGAMVSQAGTLIEPGEIKLRESIAPTLSWWGRPAVAAAGSDFLAAWAVPQQGANGVFALRLSSDGIPSRVTLDTAGRAQFSPAVASLGNEFLVVWQDTRNAPSYSDTPPPDIYGARLASDGTVLNPGGTVLSTKSSPAALPSVAFNGSNYLVVWQDYTWGPQRGIYGARLDALGKTLDYSRMALGTMGYLGRAPAVAANGPDFLVVWADNRNAAGSKLDIYGARVLGTGLAPDANAIPICTAPGDQRRATVAANGEHWLVVWEDWRNEASTYSDIYGARIGRGGQVAEPGGLAICATSADQFTPAVASNGKDFLVVWQHDGDIFGTPVTKNGSVVHPLGLPLSAAPDTQLAPTVASNGTDYLVVWADYRDAYRGADYTHVYGTAVSGAGVASDPAGVLVSREAHYLVYPAAVPDGDDYVVLWVNAPNGITSTTGAYSGAALRGARMSAGGALLDSTGFTVRTNLLGPGRPAAASGGAGLFVSVARATSELTAPLLASFVCPADGPLLRQVALRDGKATLTWQARPGKSYRVQFKAGLGTGGWNDLAGDVLAGGAAAAKVDDTLGAAAQRFYRVVELP